jgi:hypothetical protein
LSEPMNLHYDNPSKSMSRGGKETMAGRWQGDGRAMAGRWRGDGGVCWGYWVLETTLLVNAIRGFLSYFSNPVSEPMTYHSDFIDEDSALQRGGRR